MLEFLFKKKEKNINEIIQREFEYRVSLKISQGVGCVYRQNSMCRIVNPCYFKQERKCSYDRFRWVYLRDKIKEIKENPNESLKKFVEQEIDWLKEKRIEAWKFFYERYSNPKTKQKV